MDYYYFYEELKQTPLSEWLPTLRPRILDGFDVARWGDLPDWMDVLKKLPDITASSIDYNAAAIRIGESKDCDDATRKTLEELLHQLKPWRKGPFDLFGIHIDTEWRSDYKWGRLSGKIAPLNGRMVLDVGCGSGYHCLRMFGSGAKMVIGIDPTIPYVIQFHALQKYLRNPKVTVLPLSIDDMPENFEHFDTVFSMGLLYHRRSPLDHLTQLLNLLRPGGELVLETLIIDGEKGNILNPEGRYAKMSNVWFMPSVPTLEGWVKRMGFENVHCIDVSRVTPQEQRTTDWMTFQSLKDFLDPSDAGKTVEGYPAPQRAIIIARKPK